MATLNVGIKIAGAVSASGLSGTLYTAPANAYAIVNVFWVEGTSASSLTVGGQLVLSTNVTYAGSITSLYVGPGQSISATIISTGGKAYRVVGVSFINTI